MKRKRSRNFSRRARPINHPALYADSRPQPTMPELRKLLAFKRANKREPRDMMGAACEIAFGDLADSRTRGRKRMYQAPLARRAQVSA